ncbi:uncharacterized protein LOC132634358 [Lycium barbarum]|uniref:uncharacterized protein LOC132634358 n=1 Tax=Lycium barbarum TaxID=112863 RepID=UPI00293F3740|nr:uncharacterized protein LOC132634358 [Lycium barbarum]
MLSTCSEFPAHLITGTSRTTKEKVHDSVHQSILTKHGPLGVGNQKQGQHTQTAPSYPEVVVENSATVSKAVAVSNANAREPETRSGQSGARPTKSMSLNLTRIAALVNDYSSDDEIESRPDDLSVMVNGYKVKTETAPVLEKIFHKYGDIARNSSVTSVKFSSSVLELVCDIYNKLEATNLQSISSTELQSMLAEARDLESVKVAVGWLRLRLNDISQAKQLLQDSSKLKEAKTRNLVVMEMNKKGLEELEDQLATCTATCRALQERIRQKKDECGIARSEN